MIRPYETREALHVVAQLYGVSHGILRVFINVYDVFVFQNPQLVVAGQLTSVLFLLTVAVKVF
jgi:hypothetical protein